MAGRERERERERNKGDAGGRGARLPPVPACPVDTDLDCQRKPDAYIRSLWPNDLLQMESERGQRNERNTHSLSLSLSLPLSTLNKKLSFVNVLYM
jgi:hypothetical protein